MPPGRAVPPVRVEAVDRHRTLTGLAAGGLVLAVALALLGLPPVDLHGPLHRYGVMDPLCGGTRAVRLAALGEWAAAWRYNPLGPLLVLIAALLQLRAALGMLTGRWVTVGLPRRVVAAAVVVATIALGIRQQLNAGLLLAP